MDEPKKSKNNMNVSFSKDQMINGELKTILHSNQRTVDIRVIFYKIGEIDTLNEKFYAEAYIEASWYDPLNDGKIPYDPKLHWNPELSILNYFGDLKEHKWHVQYPLINDSSATFSTGCVVYERRRIQGKFWQILNLKNFPTDVQNLTLCITTSKYANEIKLQHSKEKSSSVNVKCFSDHQEWHLYKHIEFNEFLRESVFSSEQFPCLDVTVCVARRPAFFYWNAFFLIFLITLSSLAIFSINYCLPQNRIQIGCTLLLTSVSFKWVTNRSLPTISYMTSLDKYSLACIILIVLQGAWHGVIGSVTLSHGKCIDNYESYDITAFCVTCILFICLHAIFLIWLFKIGYAKRRELNKQEEDYANSLAGKRVTRLQSMICGV